MSKNVKKWEFVGYKPILGDSRQIVILEVLDIRDKAVQYGYAMQMHGVPLGNAMAQPWSLLLKKAKAHAMRMHGALMA